MHYCQLSTKLVGYCDKLRVTRSGEFGSWLQPSGSTINRVPTHLDELYDLLQIGSDFG